MNRYVAWFWAREWKGDVPVDRSVRKWCRFKERHSRRSFRSNGRYAAFRAHRRAALISIGFEPAVQQVVYEQRRDRV
jgi:hypothetical protein